MCHTITRGTSAWKASGKWTSMQSRGCCCLKNPPAKTLQPRPQTNALRIWLSLAKKQMLYATSDFLVQNCYLSLDDRDDISSFRFCVYSAIEAKCWQRSVTVFTLPFRVD